MEHVETVASAHEQITAQMCSLLRSGIIPWHTSWVTSGVPTNLITGRPYRAINAVLLAAGGYGRNQFLTKRQVHTLGAFILDGQEPYLVLDGIGFTTLRPYYVFNIEQCGGISKDSVPPPLQRNKPFDVCKEVIERMSHCPKLIYRLCQPSYCYETDTITMVPEMYYSSADAYFADLMQLLVWATCHESRLNRIDLMCQGVSDGNVVALIELMIQIGSWYLNNFCGLDVEYPEYDDEYVAYWIGKFKRDICLASTASEMAQQAVEYITGIPFDLNEAIEFLEDEKLPF